MEWERERDTKIGNIVHFVCVCFSLYLYVLGERVHIWRVRERKREKKETER